MPSFHFLMSVYSVDAMVASGVFPGSLPMKPMDIAALEREGGNDGHQKGDSRRVTRNWAEKYLFPGERMNIDRS